LRRDNEVAVVWAVLEGHPAAGDRVDVTAAIRRRLADAGRASQIVSAAPPHAI